MSACISSHGEYSSHEPGDWCPLCGAFNEDAIVAERDALAEQLAAAQAVITEAQVFLDDNENYNQSGLTEVTALDRILAQSPADALAAHNRQVAAKALTDAADAWWIRGDLDDNWDGTRWLRARAASIATEPPAPGTLAYAQARAEADGSLDD